MRHVRYEDRARDRRIERVVIVMSRFDLPEGYAVLPDRGAPQAGPAKWLQRRGIDVRRVDLPGRGVAYAAPSWAVALYQTVGSDARRLAFVRRALKVFTMSDVEWREAALTVLALGGLEGIDPVIRMRRAELEQIGLIRHDDDDDDDDT